MTRACKNCEWWDDPKEDGWGQCRVDRPQVVVTQQYNPDLEKDESVTATEFPVTAATDWCSRFIERNQEKGVEVRRVVCMKCGKLLDSAFSCKGLCFDCEPSLEWDKRIAKQGLGPPDGH